MSRYVDLDECIPMMRDVKKHTTDKNKAAFEDALITFMESMPCDRRDKVILCRYCCYYNEDTRRCSNYYGLSGKLKPTDFCSYSADNADITADVDFSETFEEFADVN